MSETKTIGGGLTLYRNLSSVAVVGVIDIAFSVASNILFPRTVPKAEFAAYRMFLLYSGYAGILHFGLLDGLYLRAVGHEATEVAAELVSRVRRRLWVLQCLASFAILPVLLRFGVPDGSIGLPLVLVGTVVATNLLTFYTYLFQATSHFGLVARMVGPPRVVGVVAAIVLIVLGGATAMSLALCVLGPVIVSAALLARWSRSMPWRGDARSTEGARAPLLPVWRDGAVLFLGNMGITLALSAGTLVASLVLDRRTFAEYAFAAGLASLMLVGFEWLGVAAAPSHARLVRRSSAWAEWELLLLVLMWLSPTIYWGARLVVRLYLPSYGPSLELLAWLSGSLPFLVIVRTRAATVCRATGRQDAFLRLGVGGAALTGMAVVGGWIYGRSATWIAAGWALSFAVLGSVGWLVVTRAYRLPGFRVDLYLVASAVAASCTFAMAQRVSSRVVGALAYLVIATLGVLLGVRELLSSQKAGLPETSRGDES